MHMNADSKQPESSKVVLYRTADGKVTVEVRFERESFWLTQKALAELFGVKIPAINKHLQNIYASGELTREATVSKMETVQTEGARDVARQVELYNLDMAIAVGYRVKQDQQYVSDFDAAFARYLKGGEKP
jgi:hypothetical protein